MELGVDTAKPAQLDAGVDLGRGDRSVAEHLLNHAEVGATREQVGGKAVPEGVRTDITRETGLPGISFDDRPERMPREGTARLRDEHGERPGVMCYQHGAIPSEVIDKRGDRAGAE